MPTRLRRPQKERIPWISPRKSSCSGTPGVCRSPHPLLECASAWTWDRTPCDFQGGNWGEDGRIIASLGSLGPHGSPFGLYGIDASGGTPQLLAKPAEHKQEVFRWPQILPGGESVIHNTNDGANYEEACVEVLTWNGRQSNTALITAATFPAGTWCG
jgi:hypothetical protein